MKNVDWLGLAGYFLVLEGVLSIVGSDDQHVHSNVGRVVRIGIGVGLMYFY